jgi:hypothetical protein
VWTGRLSDISTTTFIRRPRVGVLFHARFVRFFHGASALKEDKEHLAALLTALDASPVALERPVCRGRIGDWQITGKYAYVLPAGAGYLLYATTPEQDRLDPDGKRRCYGSARRWTNIKGELAFARLTQDGDDEGCFHLDRLPTKAEAGAIRDCLGIRKRRLVTAEARAQLEAARVLAKSPSAGRP